MNHSIKVGLSFGLTSGVITTLGLMVGLESGTSSRLAVMGGVITIAIADAASDAMGIHMSEEAEQKHTWQEIWLSTLSAFLSKAFFALIFIIPLLLFDLRPAIWVNVGLGLLIVAVSSYFVARKQKQNTAGAIFEHLGIAALVIVATHYLGQWIANTFS